VKVQEVASELGVRYLVEGSVQKTGDRARITVQLIDATTGHHLWAEKYDRNLKDIFALQDEITIKIMTALEVKLTEGEQARLRLRGPANLQAFMKGLKALEYYRRSNKEGNTLSRQEIEEAIALAPEHSGLYALLAATHISDLWYGSKFPLVSLARASKALKTAIDLDSNNSDAYLVLSNLYLMRGEHEKAIAAGERAVALNPNGADAYAQLAYALDVLDRSAESIELFKKAIRLNPIPPSYYFHELGQAYWGLGRYEEAIEAYKKAIHREPSNLFAHQGLAATYISIDRAEEAQAEAEEVVRIDPTFSLKDLEKTCPHKNRDRVKRYVEVLRKAGLK
jgi:adenylate cyclase